MVRINGLFHLLVNGVYWGYTLIMATLREKQVDLLTPVAGFLGLLWAPEVRCKARSQENQ